MTIAGEAGGQSERFAAAVDTACTGDIGGATDYAVTVRIRCKEPLAVLFNDDLTQQISAATGANDAETIALIHISASAPEAQEDAVLIRTVCRCIRDGTTTGRAAWAGAAGRRACQCLRAVDTDTYATGSVTIPHIGVATGPVRCTAA